MFSDGDDIWDERRLTCTKTSMVNYIRTNGIHISHGLFTTSYVFPNATVSAQLVEPNAGSAEITKMLLAKNDPNIPKHLQQASNPGISQDLC